MDRLDIIIVFLIVLVAWVWWLIFRLERTQLQLLKGQRAIMKILIDGALDKNPEADPAHPRDQSLG